MIVRFDFKDGTKTVADVHHSRVFSRPLDHMSSLRRKPLQMHAAGFIRAMLAPHHAENSKLGEIRITAQGFLDARVFVRSKAVLGGHLRRYFDFSIDHSSSVRRFRM